VAIREDPSESKFLISVQDSKCEKRRKLLRSGRKERTAPTMATLNPHIIPALPLTHTSIPPSPRSDVSGTTEQSRDTDRSLDRVSTAMTQLSFNPHVPSRVCNLKENG
jgi:hypothetical protein